MRRLDDPQGRPWDVVLGRESWGALYALFVPAGVGRVERIRQRLLDSESYEAAQQEIEEMSEERLARLLAESQPKP